MPNRIGVERLRRFRGRLYGCFDRRADARFEPCDVWPGDPEGGGGRPSSPDAPPRMAARSSLAEIANGL